MSCDSSRHLLELASRGLDEFDSIVDPKKVPAGFAYKWGIANYLFSYVLVYDKAKFGNNPPKSWKDFWDLKNFPGKRTMRKDIQSPLELSLMADGVPADQKKIYPIDDKRAFDKMKRSRTSEYGPRGPSQQLSGGRVLDGLLGHRATALQRDPTASDSRGTRHPCPGVVGLRGNTAVRPSRRRRSTQVPSGNHALEAFGNGPRTRGVPAGPGDLRRIDHDYGQREVPSRSLPMVRRQRVDAEQLIDLVYHNGGGLDGPAENSPTTDCARRRRSKAASDSWRFEEVQMAMTAEKQTVFDWIDQHRAALSEQHLTVWNFAEPAWREYRSAAFFVDLLRKAGFEVEAGSATMPTAFCATFGHGKPVLGAYAKRRRAPGLPGAGHVTEARDGFSPLARAYHPQSAWGWRECGCSAKAAMERMPAAPSSSRRAAERCAARAVPAAHATRHSTPAISFIPRHSGARHSTV